MSENVDRNEMISVSFAPLIASWTDQGGSITQTRAFKLVYGPKAHIEHFKATKKPLPLEDVLKDKDFLAAFNELEPGPTIDYIQFQKDVDKIRHTFARTSRRQFEKIDELLAKHNPYILSVVRFIIHDVYINVLKRYYQPSRDYGLLSLLKTPIDVYLAEAIAFQDNFNTRLVFETQWLQLRNTAVEQAQIFIPLKTAPDTTTALTNMNYLVDLAAQRRREEIQRRRERDERINQMNMQIIRANNIANMHNQIGQFGRQIVSRETVRAVAREYFNYNQQYINPSATRENLRNELAALGVTVHPDGWTEDGGETTPP